MDLSKLTGNRIITERNIIASSFLKRDVVMDAYLPDNIPQPEKLDVLLINDGQDLPVMHFDKILENLIENEEIVPLVCIGIHCGTERKMEYGTVRQPDYKGLGAKAPLYQRFVFEELIPFIRSTYMLPMTGKKSFAGFSLGGLSAFDIAWNNQEQFSKIGVFSGSLWWRNKSYRDGYDDTCHKIAHAEVRKGEYAPWLKFYFECGAFDETYDRNNNGVIDSIDDTLDLIKELKLKGYTDNDIRYLQLDDGRHDIFTWSRAFPDFLKWGWQKNLEHSPIQVF